MNDEKNIKRIENDVIILSDDKEIVSLAEKVIKELKLNLIFADDTIDLYANGYFFGIIDPEKLDGDFWDVFKEIHGNENHKEFSVLLTKKPGKKISKSIKRFFILPEAIGIDYQKLKLLILNRRSTIIRHQNSNKPYDKKLKRLFAILKMLQPENSFVKLDDLCREFNVSPKTIQRDITMMKEFGEDIHYNKERKSFYLAGSWNSTVGVREVF